MKNFECSKINANGLLLKKGTILYSKFNSGYEYSDHTRKYFIIFEHTASSDKSRFTLLNQ